VAALQTVEEEIGEGVLSSLRAPGSPPVEGLTGALINELADLPDNLAIVLDDYHLIDSDQVHGIVSFLLERLPSNVHLVIASRIDPPLPLARLRARGQIAEINAADLSFAREEAAAFLKDTMGLELSAEDIEALEGRTEGWIAGLQLAALSMRGRQDVSGFVKAFSGSHRDVLDFLPQRSSDGNPNGYAHFFSKHRFSSALRETCATWLRTETTGKRCWRGSIERACSSSLWTTSGAGTVTITSSPISCTAS